MKTTIFSILFLALTLSSNAQEKSTCELQLDSGQVKHNQAGYKWSEQNNSYKYGMISKKTIEFVGFVDPSTRKSYPITYVLNKLEKYNLFYFGSIGETAKFYSNEIDAVRALYVWNKCGVVLEKAKVNFTH